MKPVSNADAYTFLRSRQFDLSPKKTTSTTLLFVKHESPENDPDFVSSSSSSVGCREGDYELPPATTIPCQFRQLAWLDQLDQARAIAIQPAILYHTRNAIQILVEGTLEGINEAKWTQLLLYRCCIHRENVTERNSISS